MNAGLSAIHGSSGPKGVLRRMPRVESDETHHAEVRILFFMIDFYYFISK